MKSVLPLALFLASVSLAQAQTTTQIAPQAAATAAPAAAAKPQAQQGLGLGKHDSSAPINVSSDNFLGDLTTKIGTYSGNVVVVQGDMKMRADRVRVDVVDGKPTKIYSYGNVVIEAPNGTATGDNGVYDLTPNTVTLTGKVVLTKEKDVMRGTMVVMDMNTNLAHLTAKDMPGGRVQALFIPKPQDNANGTAKKPAAGTATAKKPAAAGSK
jgi:lipopolysaccharide export system protein LptA